MRLTFLHTPSKGKLILLFSLLFAFRFASAQRIITTPLKDSAFILTRDERLDMLVTRHKDINTLHPGTTGYRVQIYFGGIRQKASEIRMDFISKFPNMEAYLTYSAPNFKVRVGDFRTRLEAQKFLKTIENLYPTVFIVPDEIVK